MTTATDVCALAAIALVTVSCSVQEKIVLRCDYGLLDYGTRLQDVYSLDEHTKSARLMSVEPPRPGSLTVSESNYDLEFPEDYPAPGYQLLRVKIDRFTSKAEREIGRERTLTFQSGASVPLPAVQDSGQCVAMKGAALTIPTVHARLGLHPARPQ